MRGIRARSLGYSAGVCTLVALGWILTGQAAGPAKHRTSLPTDWSHRHVVFSRPQTAEEYARVVDEPRFLQQMYRREMPGAKLAVSRIEPTSLRNAVLPARLKPSMHRDWAVNLGTGASMGQGNYPAKFGFDVTKASCAADFVVYSTGLAGSGTQASIVGFTNIYSGCAGSPTVNWAYDTGGTILTSPVLSLDGTQVAVAETDGAARGTVVILKWAASSGSIALPAAPTNVLPAAYQACVAPCMTKLILRDNLGTATDDTTSSVFYDYKNDIIWVGGARGWVHKITGAFKGIPTEVITGGFPTQVTAGSVATSSAVYDSVSNNVFVGDGSGFVNAINASTGVVTQSAKLDSGVGIVDAPLVDQTGGFLYVPVSADSGAGSCATPPCAAVYQLSTTFAGGAPGVEVAVGNSTGTRAMYIGGLDNTYFKSSNRTGNLYACGNNGNPATLYQIPITAGAFPLTGQGTLLAQLATGGTAACSSVTDVSNPNTAIGPAERVFVSVENNGRYTTCGGGGCLFNFVVAEWQPSTTYVQNQQILNSNLHVVTAATGGTSGAAPPAWTPTSAANEINDGSVVWIDQGTLSTMNSVVGWQALHLYNSGTDRVVDSNGNVEVSTGPGLSGAATPAWSTVPGGTTPDGLVTWTNVGLAGTVALASSGGASGVIEDNVVSQATQAGGSQVYFTTLGDQACGTSGTGGCAVQASQPALQ